TMFAKWQVVSARWWETRPRWADFGRARSRRIFGSQSTTNWPRNAFTRGASLGKGGRPREHPVSLPRLARILPWSPSNKTPISPVAADDRFAKVVADPIPRGGIRSGSQLERSPEIGPLTKLGSSFAHPEASNPPGRRVRERGLCPVPSKADRARFVQRD